MKLISNIYMEEQKQEAKWFELEYYLTFNKTKF